MRLELLKEVEEEVTHLLSDLIRINTINPPGNETEAAKQIARCLSKEGFKCELCSRISSIANRFYVPPRYNFDSEDVV